MVKDIKDLEVYKIAFNLSKTIWEVAVKWDFLAQRTVGIQLIRAVDSIGANIAEGFGRFSFKEHKQFCYYARGSFEETKHWLRIAFNRDLISLEQLKNYNLISKTSLQS
jgi:four helix bundle protein